MGKSTAIMHLLSSKPSSERWAVLVNEFGEIGVDGGLISGANVDNDVYIREVPGGCMCCAAGLPMQIALAQLLAKAKPHRLLIEPTGLGHPKEVLGVLTADYNQESIAVNKIITLVDARKISDARYRQHDVFRQQLEIADIIVANKQAQYGDRDLEALHDFVSRDLGLSAAPVKSVNYGAIELDWLAGSTNQIVNHCHTHTVAQLEQPQQRVLEQGYIRKQNTGEGYWSIGWKFSAEIMFDSNKLEALLAGLAYERLKAVFITSNGVMAFNGVDGHLAMTHIDDSLDSRVEIISQEYFDPEQLEQDLLNCKLAS